MTVASSTHRPSQTNCCCPRRQTACCAKSSNPFVALSPPNSQSSGQTRAEPCRASREVQTTGSVLDIPFVFPSSEEVLWETFVRLKPVGVLVHGPILNLYRMKTRHSNIASPEAFVGHEGGLMNALLTKRFGVRQTCCVVHRRATSEYHRQIAIDMAIASRRFDPAHIRRTCILARTEGCCESRYGWVCRLTLWERSNHTSPSSLRVHA